MLRTHCSREEELHEESDPGETKWNKMKRGQGKVKLGTASHSDSRESLAGDEQVPQPRKRQTVDGPRESSMATRPEACPGPDHKTKAVTKNLTNDERLIMSLSVGSPPS